MNNNENKFNNNDYDLNFNTPVLFEKKHKKILIKKINHIKSDAGKTKHFTPAAQEWYNSVYSYNSNYIKTLPVADTNLMRLLKSYFNIEINHKFLNTKRVANRYKRLTTKKVFVGKGDLKHSSHKAIITFYVHNTNKMHLSRAAYISRKSLFYPKNNLLEYIKISHNTDKTVINYRKSLIMNDLKEYKVDETSTKSSIQTLVGNVEHSNIIQDITKETSYNRPFKLNEFMALSKEHNKAYIDYLIPYLDVNNQYLKNLDKQRDILIKMVNLNIINEEEKNKTLVELYEGVDFFKYPIFETYMERAKEYYLSGLKRLKFLLGFNNIKFSKPFISKLMSLVKNIYNKHVEFNVVNLKKMHLNSDIYTQAVALKLRNRNNKLYKVLKSSLRKVKLPEIYRVTEKFDKIDKDDLFANKIRNDNISSMFRYNNEKDSLNNLLLDFFPKADNLKIRSTKTKSLKEKNISFNYFVLKSLKHLDMRGIRVEAKGRITRRFTASRSVFKLKWIGGLKNIDSSFKGLSVIMLRGYSKSNVQYSLVSSKNRNGAFGVKGWISSK